MWNKRSVTEVRCFPLNIRWVWNRIKYAGTVVGPRTVYTHANSTFLAKYFSTFWQPKRAADSCVVQTLHNSDCHPTLSCMGKAAAKAPPAFLNITRPG